MAVSVEEVSASLVREYLSRKGFKRTIACMDEEHPRTEASINNRSHLRQILNIEGLYKKNKAVNSPLKTLLEIIVKHHIKGHKNDFTSNESPSSDPLHLAQTIGLVANCPATPTQMNDTKTEESTTAFVVSRHAKLRLDIEENCPSPPVYTPSMPETDRLSSYNQTGVWTCDSGNEKGQPLVASIPDDESFSRRDPERKTSITESAQKSRTNRIRRGMMAGPIASTPQELNKKRHTRRPEISQPLIRKEEENKLFKDGRFMADLTELHSANCVGGLRELQSAQEGMQRENCTEKVGQDFQKTRK